ncbi:hypothetical protein QFC22_004125 [Naganishia vaughanmartiniae]|uniref:Uncharacterized protein n=1 Tax=Naganishia vaughanmartiniae TaxID=1424756 RepID=A0ACC2X475_9TREE|nr:hypothetical protein QFC22_004125 [Naganishia vaughanmartiniae]
MESASPDVGSQLAGRSLPTVTEAQPGSAAMTKQPSRVTFDPASPENKTGRHGPTTSFHRPNRFNKKIDWHVHSEREVPAFEQQLAPFRQLIEEFSNCRYAYAEILLQWGLYRQAADIVRLSNGHASNSEVEEEAWNLATKAHVIGIYPPAMFLLRRRHRRQEIRQVSPVWELTTFATMLNMSFAGQGTRHDLLGLSAYQP